MVRVVKVVWVNLLKWLRLLKWLNLLKLVVRVVKSCKCLLMMLKEEEEMTKRNLTSAAGKKNMRAMFIFAVLIAL